MVDETILERIINRDEDPKDLPLALLQSVTNDFSQDRKIGQGGFGEVYKGELRNGIIVAVKRMLVNEHTVDDVSFRREVNSLMKINHQNVVRFLGFCSHAYHTYIKVAGSADLNFVNVREILLCLEYINNGSLDKHITDELRGLEWKTRYEIIMGICKGLCYLHEEKEIVHMDLKPANILLDDNMVPIVTDFGLSRPNGNSHTMGQRFGTRGYFAPEYENAGKTSVKSDIYSLGAIIIELVTGCIGVPVENNVLRRWKHRWNKPPMLLQYHQVTRCINIAVRCRQQEPGHRPSISEIISILSEPVRANEHTGQESIYIEDDMLHIDPLELHFTFKPNKEMSWSVRLTNKTKASFAFNIENPVKHYTIQPDKGIVTPGCNDYLVKIISQPQEWAPQVIGNADKFIVRSTKVTGDLRGEDITRYIFHGEVPGKVIDEVDLMVVYEKGSRKRGQDPNVTVEAVPPKRKAINSSSYEEGTRGKLDLQNYHLPENFSHRQPTNRTYLPRVSDRAMDVTRGAMGSLLHKLGELLKEEFNLETSVKEDIKSLSEELMKMHVVLHKMSEVQQDNLDALVKHWSSNVREMSYNLEDFVDGFLVHNEPESNNSRFTELTHEMCLLLGKGNSHLPIGSLIKHHITKQVQDRKALVGIQEPRDDLIKRLSQVDRDVSAEQQLGIFSIYGPGGLGKTTLVKAVYDELKGNFHLTAFVSVGRNPDKKQVLHDILAALDNNSSRGTFNAKQLINELHTLLEKKRYFIVIDDIWDSPTWGIIKYAFPENNLGSRVVTTTRNHSVAVVCCNSCAKNVCKMETLGDIDSRRLFVTRVFGLEDACPDVPEDILTVILKKCGGLPLAIISIASLVAKDPTTWSTWDYVRNSLISLFEGDNPTLTDMEQILDLSYRHLPDHLKTCLLHVCMYPEDEEIDKNDLLRQWVAEGFVVSTNGRLDVEDVAEEYFKELISMCMIQPGRIEDHSNEVLSCTVHDIILDLMRSKSSEENFSHVIDGSKTWSHGKIRRISVHGNDKEDSAIFETIKGSLLHARSALFFRYSPVRYLLVFKYIRVLHIILGGIGDLDLTGITRLVLLRYLKIYPYYEVLKLPDQIGELRHLETLDLEGCELEKYPSDIVHLPWLSYLRYGHGASLSDGVERLKSLRTLEGVYLFKSSVENIKGLGKLTNLRKLQIFLNFRKLDEATTDMHMDALHSSISKLSSSLRFLTLGGEYSYFPSYILDVPRVWSSMTLFPDGSAIRELDLFYCRFERCPGWISQLSNLYKFSVTVREVSDGLNIVAGLSSLAIFLLGVDGVEEEKEESVVIPGCGAFKALKELIFNCPKAALTFEPGAMPKLEKLVMCFRYGMTPQFLPVGIQHLPAPTLKEIWLFLEEGYIKVGSEDWDSDMCRDKQTKHDRKLKAMLQKAFKQHHPGADICVYFESHVEKYLQEYNDEEYCEEDDNKEEDDEEYYFTGEVDDSVDDEEHFSTEEDEEAACQVNVSQTSAQVHADHTRQLVLLIEEQQDSGGTAEPQAGAAYQVNGSPALAQVQANIRQLVQITETHQDSGRRSINTDASPMVDMLPHPAVRLPGWQSRRDQAFVISDALQLSFTAPLAPSPSSLHLTPYSLPNRAERMANFHFDINNDHSVERSI